MSTSDREELRTLEADLRNALQHQHAEYERVRELQGEIEALMETARTLIAARVQDGAEVDTPITTPADDASGSTPVDAAGTIGPSPLDDPAA